MKTLTLWQNSIASKIEEINKGKDVHVIHK